MSYQADQRRREKARQEKIARDNLACANIDNSSLLARLRELPSVPSKIDEEAKKWGKGIVIFLNPEIRCCYCTQGVASGRVWVLDEAEDNLLRVVRIKDGMEEQVGECHPHVGSGGGICKEGSVYAPGAVRRAAGSGSEALFMGLNPDSAYGGKDVKWFLGRLGHECWRGGSAMSAAIVAPVVTITPLPVPAPIEARTYPYDPLLPHPIGEPILNPDDPGDCRIMTCCGTPCCACSANLATFNGVGRQFSCYGS